VNGARGHGVLRHGERVGAKAVAAAAERLTEAAQDQVPRDVRVAREGTDVVLSGRRLRARSLDDPRLRGLGLLAKDGR